MQAHFRLEMSCVFIVKGGVSRTTPPSESIHRDNTAINSALESLPYPRILRSEARAFSSRMFFFEMSSDGCGDEFLGAFSVWNVANLLWNPVDTGTKQFSCSSHGIRDLPVFVVDLRSLFCRLRGQQKEITRQVPKWAKAIQRRRQ